MTYTSIVDGTHLGGCTIASGTATIPRVDKIVGPGNIYVAAAKKLLAEAGYPNGFGVTLHTSVDRFARDSDIGQVIGEGHLVELAHLSRPSALRLVRRWHGE